jgi:ATP-dependent DNA helicase DinG
VVVIADVRLKTKPYGIVFLESLPPMPVTRDIADVEEFFNT